MIIALSGKKQHGKDLVCAIMRFLIAINKYPNAFHGATPLPKQAWVQNIEALAKNGSDETSGFKIKRFADKLKDMVCMLIGCTREQLENEEFKNTPLGEKWTRYAYADGHNDHYRNGEWTKSMNSVFCSKEKYEEEYRINWPTAYKSELTPRLLLQLLGTNCGRDIIHSNIWVNATMADYTASADVDISIPPQRVEGGFAYKATNIQYPNWIIPDVRFPNEIAAIEKAGGIMYRIERPSIELTDLHESETALDNHNFGEKIISNSGSIESLIAAVEFALRRDKILPDA